MVSPTFPFGVPHLRGVVAAVVSTAVLAVLLNRHLCDWVGAVNLAIGLVLEGITLILALRSLIGWMRRRRGRDDDPPRYQSDFGLAA